MDLRGYNTSAILAYRFDKVEVPAGYAKRDNGNYFAGEKGRDPERWHAGAHPFGFGEQVANISSDNESHLLRTGTDLPAEPPWFHRLRNDSG